MTQTSKIKLSCISFSIMQNSFSELITQAKKADAYNFHSFWIPDHTIAGNLPAIDVWTLFGALAVKTKNIRFCTGVSDTHRIHPAIMAQKVATLDHLSNGRAMLGIGVGEVINCDLYGIPRTHSMKKLREYINVLRLLWEKRKNINYSGEYFQLKKAIAHRPKQKNVPIYIGANGPKMCEISGEIGDGWFPAYLSPEAFAGQKKFVETGIKKSKNPEKKLETYDFALLAATAIGDDHQALLKSLDIMRFMYVGLPHNFNTYYNLNIPSNFHCANHDTPPDPREINKISDKILEDLNVIGTVDECIAQIEEFQKAGVTHLALFALGDWKEVYDMYHEKIIPYFL